MKRSHLSSSGEGNLFATDYCWASTLSYRCCRVPSGSDKFFPFGINGFSPPREDDSAICPDYSQRPASPGRMDRKYNGRWM